MGQIITSLINFLLEVGRSGRQYRTTRNKSKTSAILITVFLVLSAFIASSSFFAAYEAKIETIKLKDQVAELEHLYRKTEALTIRNEILSTTLAHYIGKSLVETINKEESPKLKEAIKEEIKKDVLSDEIVYIP